MLEILNIARISINEKMPKISLIALNCSFKQISGDITGNYLPLKDDFIDNLTILWVGS